MRRTREIVGRVVAFAALFLGAAGPAAGVVVSPAPVSRAATLAARSEVEVPRNDGWVTDLARLLDADEERQLEAALEAYKRGSGHDLAVLTVPDLKGRSIEEFALEVARTWKLGSVETHDGALLVVAKAERQMRIEVGRGLEGMLTDARCAQIIRNEITPLFKAGRFGDGIRNGVAAMQAAAGGAPANVARTAPARSSDGGGIGGLVCVVVFLIFFLVVLSRLKRLGGGTWTSGRRSWGGGTWTWGVGGGGRGFGGGGGGFGGFGGGGGFSGGGASGRW